MQLTITSKFRESFLLDRCRFELDPVEHGGGEDVDTGVDTVADKFDWLFDEAVDHRLAGHLHHDTVFGRLVDFGDLFNHHKTQ